MKKLQNNIDFLNKMIPAFFAFIFDFFKTTFLNLINTLKGENNAETGEGEEEESSEEEYHETTEKKESSEEEDDEVQTIKEAKPAEVVESPKTETAGSITDQAD